jgi:hypothetical protein
MSSRAIAIIARTVEAVMILEADTPRHAGSAAGPLPRLAISV